MKVVSELIDYFKSNLTVQDLQYLKEQGFYSGEIYEDHFYDDYWEEPEYYEDEPAELEKEELAVEALNEEQKRARKGKGGRSRKKEPRYQLSDFKKNVRDYYISDWEKMIAPLYPLCTRVKGKGNVRKALFRPYEWEEKKIVLKVFELLKYHGNWEGFKNAVMAMETLLHKFLDEAQYLGPKDQQRAQQWVMGEKEMRDEPDGEGILWIKQAHQLQVYALQGLEKYLQQECVKLKKETLAFEQFITSQPELFILLLLRDFSRNRNTYVGSPNTLALHLLAPETCLEKAMDAFFVCAPQDFVQTMQSLDNLPEPEGADSCETEVNRRFSRLPLPEWALKLRRKKEHIWHVRGSLLKSQEKSLGLPCKITFSLDLKDSFAQNGFVAYHLSGRPFTNPVNGLLPCSDGIFDLEKMELRAGNYEDMRAFSEGLAPCKRTYDSLWEFIDEWGQTQIPAVYREAYPFSQGLAAVREARKWGFINTAGEVKIPFQYKGVKSFSENRAAVRTSGLWSFIDLNGEKVINPQYPKVDSFSEGLAVVGNGHSFGLIDLNGHLVVPLKYREVKPFSEGLAAVYDGNSWGFIDKKGVVVIPCQYNRVQSFSDGRAVVRKDWHLGDFHIDKNGKVLGKFPFGNFAPYQKNACVVMGKNFPGKPGERQNLYTPSGELVFKGLPGYKILYVGEKILIGEFDSEKEWYLVVPISKVEGIPGKPQFANSYESSLHFDGENYAEIKPGIWLQSDFLDIIINGEKMIGLRWRKGFFFDWEQIKIELSHYGTSSTKRKH